MGAHAELQNSRSSPSGRKASEAERETQAGAELCQAQNQLGWTKD
jgi:hypothetical protein